MWSNGNIFLCTRVKYPINTSVAILKPIFNKSLLLQKVKFMHTNKGGIWT